jgi:hypothetical protein
LFIVHCSLFIFSYFHIFIFSYFHIFHIFHILQVEFSDKFYKHMIESGSLESSLLGDDEEDSVDWQGAVIAVVGLYDKGELIVVLIVLIVVVVY